MTIYGDSSEDKVGIMTTLSSENVYIFSNCYVVSYMVDKELFIQIYWHHGNSQFSEHIF